MVSVSIYWTQIEIYVKNSMPTDNDERIPKKSKTQQKRDAEAAQALGAELVKLSAAQLKTLVDKLELPDNLREALLACQSINAREAHRRQLQYIGRLMRDIELEPIQQQLVQVKRGGQVATAQLHQIERWRERLLSEEGEGGLNELLQQYPETDTRQLRQLIDSAHKEAEHSQPPRAARLLFKYLRELMAS